MQNFGRAFRLIMFGFAFVTILSIQTKAQCVQCAPSMPDGWICVPAKVGGGGCQTDGMHCNLTSPCTAENDLGCARDDKSTPKAKMQFRFPEELVREVGRSDARLAIALLTLEKLPLLHHTEGRVNSAPVKLDETDVEMFLAPAEKSKEYFLRLKERMKDAFASGLSATVYHYTIEKSANSPGGYLLKIQVEKKQTFDSNYSVVEIELNSVKTENLKQDGEILEAKSWRGN
jgi:hypothetical protein